MKSKITFFFIFLFIGLIATPTLLSLTNNEQNISFFLDMGEEEESNGNESSESKLDTDLKLHQFYSTNTFLENTTSNKKDIRFYCENYISKYPKIKTPPPKNIL